MGARLPVVDAHVHLWDLDCIRYPWLQPPFTEDGPNGSVERIAKTYHLDDYLTDASGWDVRGIVHVEAGADPAASVDETTWLQDMADTRGLPSGIVAFAPLDGPDVEALLQRHATHPNIRGVRHIVNWHSDPKRTYTSSDLTRTEQWTRGFALLDRFDLSFDLQCYPAQMPRFADVAGRYPEVRVIVNHLGMPVLSDVDGMAEWRQGMGALARLPQISVKLSGGGLAFRPWSIDRIRPLVLETIDLFGPRRCLIASDFPTDKLFGGFDQTLDAYAEIISDFSEDERRDLFGRNASRVYRLGLDL